jgi:hypothetical protein
VQTAALIASVAAAVEEDRRVTIETLAAAHGASLHTIHRILREDLGLEKKTVRWVPRLLSPEQKDERVEACAELIAAVQCHSMAMMDQIVTMDETMVCYHTPETKRQSKQWVKRGQPGPIKAKVHASRMKQMVMAFFDSKGLIYTHIVPKGQPVNANHIVSVLSTFLRHLRKKQPELSAQQWWFPWDNAPVHTGRHCQKLDCRPQHPDVAAPAVFTRLGAS